MKLPFIEQCTPQTLDEVDFDHELTKRLKFYAQTKKISGNMIFCGVKGCGKRTKIDAFLQEIYGPVVRHRRVYQEELSKLNIVYVTSTVHTELNFKSYDYQDRLVIGEFIKPHCTMKNVASDSVNLFVVYHAEFISELGQKMLLSIIEKSGKTARFIFVTNTLSKMLQALISRCMVIRCRAPSKSELENILLKVASKMEYQITRKSNRIRDIVDECWPDMRSALHILQMSHAHIGARYKMFESILTTSLRDIEDAVKKGNIAAIRTAIYRITAKNIDATLVIRKLLTIFLSKTGDDLVKYQLIQYAAKYQLLLQRGNKTPFYIEAFVARAKMLMC